jgi:hypothetical protein
MLAALLTYIIAVKAPGGSDIVLFRSAATAILHGESPYTAIPALVPPQLETGHHVSGAESCGTAYPARPRIPGP